MNIFTQLEGTVTDIYPTQTGRDNQSSCSLLISMSTESQGSITVTADSSTFLYNRDSPEPGDRLVVFYDSMAPVPLIYPPRYSAVALAKAEKGIRYVLDYFDETLTSSDGSLRLTLSASVPVTLRNGLHYQGLPFNHYLFVAYGPSTRSIPAVTTPYHVVVFCK